MKWNENNKRNSREGKKVVIFHCNYLKYSTSFANAVATAALNYFFVIFYYNTLIIEIEYSVICSSLVHVYIYGSNNQHRILQKNQ